MKLRYTFLIACTFILTMGSSVVFAQIGIKAGLSTCGLLLSSEREYNDYRPFLGYEVGWLQNEDSPPRFGLQAGVFYAVAISKHFAFQPELFYAARGLNFANSILDDTAYRVKINYLELPLNMHYKLLSKSGFKLALFTGPYFALKLNARKVVQTWNNEQVGKLDNVENFDYGLVFGTNVEFKPWNRPLCLDLRLNLGLASIMRTLEGGTKLYDDAGTVKNIALVILAGYTFELKRQSE